MKLLLLFIISWRFSSDIIIDIEYKYLSLKTKNFSISYKGNKYNIHPELPLPSIKICIGINIKQCVNVIIDTFSQTTWIANNKTGSHMTYSEYKSNTYTPVSDTTYLIHYNTFEFLGKLGDDYISFDNYNKNFLFNYYVLYSIDYFKLGIDGLLGLARLMDLSPTYKKINTLYELLYRENIITLKSYSFANNPRNGKLQFYIGEIPSHIDINKTSKCKSVLLKEYPIKWLNNFWNCKLDYIIIKGNNKNNKISIKAPAYFATGRRYITFPYMNRRILDYLYVIGNALSKCIKQKDFNDEIVLCDLFDISKIEEFIFHFDDIELILSNKDIFFISELNQTKVESVIRIQDTISEIIIGYPLLKNYDIIFEPNTAETYFSHIQNIPIYYKYKIYLCVIHSLCLLWIIIVYVHLKLFQINKIKFTNYNINILNIYKCQK